MADFESTSPSSDSLVPKLPAPPAEKKTSRYESTAMKDLFRTVKVWFAQEWDRQGTNRYQMALDEDYYDGLQWDEEDAKVLIDRGQAPVVYNEIKASIDWMIGTERRMKTDYKVLARRKDGVETAESKTSLLKYLSDTNNSPFHRSHSFDDAIKAGMGILETGLRGDPTEELLFERYQDWRSVLYDSNSIEHDLSDARYFFRWKDLDEDIALAYFSDRADVIKSSVKNDGESSEVGDWTQHNRTDPSEDWSSKTGRYVPYDSAPFSTSQRRVVRFFECWYRKPALHKVFIAGDLMGKKFDKSDPSHMAAAQQGYGLYDKLAMEIRIVIYTSSGIVFEGESPYRHGRIPFVVSWCYRRKRDNAPYGMIRALRDPQDGLNKRHSKAHYILSTKRVKMEEGAVEDIENLRDEVARSDGIIVVRPGKMDALDVDADTNIAAEHINLMERDALFIRQIGGVNAENLGRQTNATSGVAIGARQEQGSITSTEPFDNHRYALQQLGEMQLSLVEQFYTEEKQIRILGPKGNAVYVELNSRDADGRILNDISAMEADFVIDEIDYKSSLRQAMFESLFEMMSRMAQMGDKGLEAALAMLDLVVDMSDLSNKDELVKRVRQITGQRDADAEQTPEEMQAEGERKKQEAAAAELTQRAAVANVTMLEARVTKLQSEVDKLDSESLVKMVTAMYEALQAAQIVATVPGVAPVADQLLQGAGYQDVPGGQDPGIAYSAEMTAPQPAAPQMPPELQQADGAAQGIETMQNDGTQM